MKVDLTTSTCVIEDRRWPIVAVVCPDNPDQSEPRAYHRSLGGVIGPITFPNGVRAEQQVEVFIPMENGAMAFVTFFVADGLYSVEIDARTCDRAYEPNLPRSDNTFVWVPWSLRIVRNVLCHPRNITAGTGHWDHAEGEWLNEHLDRLSRMEVLAPEGPQVELIRFGDLDRLPGKGEQ